jgi:hypothetical protein
MDFNLFFFLKLFVSSLLIMGSSFLALRYPGPAGVVVALPVTTFLSLAWARFAGQTNLQTASFLESVGWITFSGLGLFFLTPYLLRSGYSFWFSFSMGFLSLVLGCYVVLYVQRSIS